MGRSGWSVLALRLREGDCRAVGGFTGGRWIGKVLAGLCGAKSVA